VLKQWDSSRRSFSPTSFSVATLASHLLEEVLVPIRRPGRQCRTRAARGCQIHARAVQHARRGDRCLRPRSSSEPHSQPNRGTRCPRDRSVDDRHLEVERVDHLVAGTTQSTIAWFPCCEAQCASWESATPHHLVAAHVDDRVDVARCRRALLDTTTARGAGPQDSGSMWSARASPRRIENRSRRSLRRTCCRAAP